MTRPRAVAVAVVAALAVGLAALAAWQPWGRSVRGVSLEVRGVGSVNANPNAGEGASQSAGPNIVQIRGGRAVVNGRDGGPLRPGDSVLVDEQGRLFVNGRERETK